MKTVWDMHESEELKELRKIRAGLEHIGLSLKELTEMLAINYFGSAQVKQEKSE